jgi:hypothetical protein
LAISGKDWPVGGKMLPVGGKMLPVGGKGLPVKILKLLKKVYERLGTKNALLIL